MIGGLGDGRVAVSACDGEASCKGADRTDHEFFSIALAMPFADFLQSSLSMDPLRAVAKRLLPMGTHR